MEGRAGQGARLLRWTFTGRDFIPLNTPVERVFTVPGSTFSALAMHSLIAA